MLKYTTALLLILILFSAPFTHAEHSGFAVLYDETVIAWNYKIFGVYKGEIGEYAYYADKILSTGELEIKKKDTNSTEQIVYAIFHRKILLEPPKFSAPFVPHYNESMPIPEDLKNITKQIAEKSDTYFEFFINTAWYIHNTIKYVNKEYPEEKIPKNKWEENFTKDTLWKLIRHIWHDKKGVCRHKALIMIAMLKYAGVDAKFVTGSVIVQTKTYNPYNLMNITNITNPNNIELTSDYLGLYPHAWVLAYDPAIGWIPIDPTRMDNWFTFMKYDNFAETYYNITNYYPFINSILVDYDVKINRIVTGNIITYNDKNNDAKIVTANNFGLLYYNRKEQHIEYIPHNYALLIKPADKNFQHSNSPYIRKIDGNLHAFKIKNKYYIRIDHLTNKKLYIVDKNNKQIPPNGFIFGYTVFNSLEEEGNFIILHTYTSDIRVPITKMKFTEFVLYNIIIERIDPLTAVKYINFIPS